MKCDLGDLTIFYETYGTGRPIVMLPGRPSDHRVMARFMEPPLRAAGRLDAPLS
jgi:pimeloyl-ACP methyl ester carboxylesterase